jgi:hypothetical protein
MQATFLSLASSMALITPCVRAASLADTSSAAIAYAVPSINNLPRYMHFLLKDFQFLVAAVAASGYFPHSKMFCSILTNSSGRRVRFSNRETKRRG